MDLGDGVRAIYQNLTVTDEPIQHRYESPGVYKVTVKAENMAGHDEATMYIQVTGGSAAQSAIFLSLSCHSNKETYKRNYSDVLR